MPIRAFSDEWKFIVNLRELLVNQLSRYEMVQLLIFVKDSTWSLQSLGEQVCKYED